MESLSQAELVSLIESVFPPLAGDHSLAILVDIPANTDEDSARWRERRDLARSWYAQLQAATNGLPLEAVDLIAYPSVGSNNADLPRMGYFIENDLPAVAEELPRFGGELTFEEIFNSTSLFLALTEYSATAPLKVAAKKYGFRAATMPGFSSKMIPALRIDYGLVSERVQIVKEKLDRASAARVEFLVDNETPYEMLFDLRHRMAHASSGRFPEPGTAGNLPSGEAYIVPYEGEGDGPSETRGTLPVQFGDEIVLFQVDENRAEEVVSEGQHSREQAEFLRREPAYGNMAELGFGILADFGLEPIGEVLLDEKLGFHIAFGRSEHFGGIVGPEKFSSPQAVVHIDRIYLPQTQPRIQVRTIELDDLSGYEVLMEDGKYIIF